MNSRYSRRSLLILGLLAILTIHALAQAPNDKSLLKGKVLDPNRAAIEGADVWISKAGLPSSTAVTDRNGEFSVALMPGVYEVRISAEGFTETTETVALQGNNKPLEVLLAVGPSNAVGVSAILVILVDLMHGNVGFAQFGYRFILDATPLLLVLLGIAMPQRASVPFRIAVLVGAIVTAYAYWAISIDFIA